MNHFVYVLVNTEGHRKVGYTRRLPDRISELAPCSPYPCELEMTYSHPLAEKVEDTLHKLLASDHMHSEWFDCDIQRVKSAIPIAAIYVANKKPPEGASDDASPISEALNDRIRMARQRAGYKTAKSAAEALGVGQVSYRAWENGWREPQMRDIRKICKTFFVSADYLLAIDLGGASILKDAA